MGANQGFFTSDLSQCILYILPGIKNINNILSSYMITFFCKEAFIPWNKVFMLYFMKLATKEQYRELYTFYWLYIFKNKRHLLNNKMQHSDLLSEVLFFKVWPNLVSCHCFGRTWNSKYVKFEWFPEMLFYQTGNFRKDLERSLQFLRHQGGPAMAAKMICSSSWS